MILRHCDHPDLGELSSSRPKQYSEHQEALRIAEELDKEDIFDRLLVPDAEYAYKKATGSGKKGVGIVLDPNIHGSRSPILPHQSTAVRHFLSKFRGVGILADEVGMGKTIEAGMVLSELAERGSIGSLLVVAENLDNWLKTLTEIFGVTDGVVVSGGKEILANCEYKVPQRPMFISMKNFCRLNLTGLDMCFDAVVVDEAHNFGILEECRRGMYVLSHLMKAKHKADKPYCILVSGTPHNGTLDSMFPLWYFITSRGDVGDAFDPNRPEGASDAMNKAYAHYHEHLCNGANTVAEFIESFKTGYLKADPKFASYIAEHGDKTRLQNAEYARTGDFALREAYLDAHPDEEKEIRVRTSDSYQSLLSSFMIRQSRREVARATEKRALNYYFCPTGLARKNQTARIELPNNTYRTDAESLAGHDLSVTVNCADYYGDGAVSYQGKDYSLDAFTALLYDTGRLSERGIRADRVKHEEKTDIVFDSLQALGVFDAFCSGDKSDAKFAKKAEEYYYNLFRHCDPRVDNRVELIDSDKNTFVEKAEKLVRLCVDPEFSDKRLILFFDYYSRSKEVLEEPARLYDWLKKNAPLVARRVIYAGDYPSGDAAAQAFLEDKTGRAVLFADEGLSESHNLQYACSTVVNFSVCYSPIKMDQRIGRIDRIGQQQSMRIISFADMNSLDGFLLAFYNKIGLFSGWRDDIILVTGCDNENSSMKRCADCEMVVLSLDNSAVCPKCQGALRELENTTDYGCNQCDFTLRRTRIGGSYAYVCPTRGGKPLIGAAGEENKGVYHCDKKCLLEHCSLLSEENCEVRKLLAKNYNCDINRLYNVCTVCRSNRKNPCPHCSLDIPAQKCGDDCPTRVNLRCKPYSVRAAAGADCPVCKQRKREGKLAANTPTTFDSFAKFIWTLNDFVDNFRFESDKITEILETLRTDAARGE